MSLADGCHEWALQSNLISVDRVDGSLRDAEATVWVSDGCDINGLPLNRDTSGAEDLLHGSRDFWTNSIARDQRDFAGARGEGSQLSRAVRRVDLKRKQQQVVRRGTWERIRGRLRRKRIDGQ